MAAGVPITVSTAAAPKGYKKGGTPAKGTPIYKVVQNASPISALYEYCRKGESDGRARAKAPGMYFLLWVRKQFIAYAQIAKRQTQYTLHCIVYRYYCESKYFHRFCFCQIEMHLFFANASHRRPTNFLSSFLPSLPAHIPEPDFDCVSENVLDTWQRDNRTFKKTEYTIRLIVADKTYFATGNTKKLAKNRSGRKTVIFVSLKAGPGPNRPFLCYFVVVLNKSPQD